MQYKRSRLGAKYPEVLAEASRVLRDGGTIIIMETLGTGYETPCPPDFLKELLRGTCE